MNQFYCSIFIIFIVWTKCNAYKIQSESTDRKIQVLSSLLQPIKETRIREESSLRNSITECTDGICTEDEKSCMNQSGEPIGSCSSSKLGVCCKINNVPISNVCGQVSNERVTLFKSPDFPIPNNNSQVCMYVLNIIPTTCAVRVDFLDIKLKKPFKYTTGSVSVQKCIYDSFYIFNAHESPSEPLCELENFSGVFYIKDSSIPIKFLFIAQSDSWYWKLKVTQINCTGLKPWENFSKCGRQLMYEEPNLEEIENAIPVVTYIVNGLNAEKNEFPYQISIRGPVKGHHRCGASIISPQFLLTASHCFSGGGTTDLEKLEVVLGNQNSTLGGESIGIERIILHYDYKSFLFHINDIAIVKLKRNITFTNFIQPICLPTADYELEDQTEGIVSGYGATNGSSKVTNGTSVQPTHLQKLRVKVISNSECRERMKNIVGSGKETMISDSQLCAISLEPNSTVCFGDSGGPLVTQNNDGTLTQIGVVSYGLGRCIVDRPIPVVYSRISEFLKFVSIATISMD